MMLHSSASRFSTGVPVRATRTGALRLRALRLCLASTFLMFCASSSTTAAQSAVARVTSSRGKRLYVVTTRS